MIESHTDGEKTERQRRTDRKNRDRQTERQTDRETDRQRDRQTDRQVERHDAVKIAVFEHARNLTKPDDKQTFDFL